MRKIYTIIFILSVSGNLYSQEDSMQTKDLDEVVVTGQFKPQSVRNSIYQVRIISKERIQKQAPARLQDLFNNELNIRFSQDVATGGSGITMVGMKGQNVKILVDGLPMTGRQGSSNEIDINQIDINTIERIEIVEGPMSVVYGADALAGVINIITKKAPSGRIAVSAKLHEESIGNEYGIRQGIHNQYAALAWRHKHWEIGGGVGKNHFSGWKDTAMGRELAWHKNDQLLANGFIGYSKGKFSIRYRLNGLDEIITNPGNFLFREQSSGDTLANDQEYLTQRLVHQVQSSIYANARLNLQLQTSYTNYNRQVFSTTVSKSTGDTRLDMGPGRQAEVDFRGFVFRGTVYYKLSSLILLQPGVDINLDRGEGERLKAGSNAINDFAFFVSSELTPSSKVNIRPGIRIISNSVYNAPPVIPSLNTKFVLSKSMDLRLAYARGFRSPSLRELYFNFFDANHQIMGNPELKAETSHSLTGSLSWKKINPREVAYNTILGGFYNSIKNLIDYAVSAGNTNIFILSNVSNSKTAGISLSTILKYKEWNISAGASYTGFYNDYSESDKSLPQLQWSAEVNTAIDYTFRAINFDVHLFYKFTGKRPYYVINSSQDLVHSEQEGYHMADLTMNKKLSHYFTVYAGIRNLFDVDRITSTAATGSTHTSNGTRNIACGRSFFAGILFSWEKK